MPAANQPSRALRVAYRHRHAGIVAALALLLAACASPGLRTAPPAQPPAQLPSVAPEVLAPEPAPIRPASPPAASIPEPPAPADPWARLRDGLRFAGCAAADGAVQSERQRLLRDRTALQAQLERVLPKVDFVLTELEAAGLPSEFALLPLVESGYRALPARGNRPAGDWQFMPSTARANGLRIDHNYDGRLDLPAATTAATRLLSRLGAAFEGDWSLATMAFNAGEFRVRRARSAQPGAAPTALPVSRTTRTHLARLRAIACVVADPVAAGVELPPWDDERRLVAVAVASGAPLSQAALWTGIEVEALRALNPAHRGGRIGAGTRLLLPATAAGRFEEGLSLWIASGAAVDMEHVVRAGESLWTIARRHGVTIRELARHNRIDPARPLRPGQVLLLPLR